MEQHGQGEGADLMAKPGRKRRQGSKREPNGQPQRAYTHQKEAENLRVVVDARQKHLGISKERATDPDWGHTLGILRLKNIISKQQMDAGNKYMIDYYKWCRLVGFPPRTPKCASYTQMIAGMASGYMPDNDAVKASKQRVLDAQKAIVESLGFQQSIPAFKALERFAIDQEHWGRCNPSSSGPLKECLNALVRHYGI